MREIYYFRFLEVVQMEDLSPNGLFCDLQMASARLLLSSPLQYTKYYTFHSINVDYVLELNSVLLRMKSFTSTR